MEKKPNIPPTPWEISIFDDKTIRMTDKKLAPTAICNMFNKNADEYPLTASAIVTAVNCTYGSNINPKKIQELVIWAEEISKKVNTLQRENQLPSWIRDEIGELKHAIDNIKYK